jgi:hypothetical protein
MTNEQRLAADLAWASEKIAALYRDVGAQLRQQARVRQAAARRLSRAAR